MSRAPGSPTRGNASFFAFPVFIAIFALSGAPASAASREPPAGPVRPGPARIQAPPAAEAAGVPIPWAGLESPPADLLVVLRAGDVSNATRRARALAAIADDPVLSPRSRGVASFRLGLLDLEARRWDAAEARLTAEALAGTRLVPDALHLLADGLPAARRDRAIAALERLTEDHPDYRNRPEARLLLGRLLAADGRSEEAEALFETVAREATDSDRLRGEALAARAGLLERAGRHAEAAPLFETLYYDLPTHDESLPAGRRLSKLYRLPGVESPPPEVRYPRALRRADGFAAARSWRRAHENYLEALRRFGEVGDAEAIRLRIGIAEFHRGRLSASLRTLVRIRRPDLRPEALYYRGEALRRLERLSTQSQVLEELLALGPDTGFGGRALYSLARARIAKNDHEAALPYWTRLAESFPNAPDGLRAQWYVLWNRYRNGDPGEVAEPLERVARENPDDFMAGQFLYFAGRAHRIAGREDRAADLFHEVLRGYRNSFYGRRAGEELAGLGRDVDSAAEIEDREALLDGLRVRRADRAMYVEELAAAGRPARARAAALAAAGAGEPDDGAFHAMNAWLLSEADRNVPAIQAMRRAAPFLTSVAGDALPAEFWKLFYPLQYERHVLEQSARRELDPYLVLGLIRQESAFIARTRSVVGARGLMQVMPTTGRALARAEGVRWGVSRLYDPAINIRFGTRYMRQLLDEFAGRADYALAGYNAGPHRVRTWTGMDMTIPSEQFIEQIPFTETRNYVKLVLRNEMLYRRLYPELPAPENASRP